MKVRTKTNLLITTALVMSAITAAPVNAQTTDAAVTSDEIVVTGFRNSLKQARDLKRDSVNVQDSIVAEDIAKFPDLNLAESLQRVPGVTITRNRGEGSQISLRGLGPEFTRVQINGMEVLANTNRNRGFEFNVFASELFNRIDVKKAYEAQLDEGGIGGTVNLHTAQPFDYRGSKIALNAQLGTNTNAENLDQRYSALLSQNWGDFGALVSVSFSERTSQGEDRSTFRYRSRTLSEADTSGLPAAIQTALANGDIVHPRGNRIRISTEDQERLGVTAAMQWRPSDTIQLNLNGLYSEYNVDRSAENIQTRGSSSLPTRSEQTVAGEVFPQTTVNELRVNSANEVVFGSYSNANIGTESTRNGDDVTFYQFTLDGDWDVSERLTVSGLVGYARSEFEAFEDKFYNELFADVVLDYEGGNRFDPINVYAGNVDGGNPAIWRAHEIDLRDTTRENDFFNVKFDTAYIVNDAITATAGFNYKSFENDGDRATASNLLRSDWQNGVVDDDISQIGYAVEGPNGNVWVGVDPADGLDFFGITRDTGAGDTNEIFTIKEDVYAGYLQFDIVTDLGGLPVRANAGVRYVSLDRENNGVLVTSNGTLDRVVNSSRDDFLPSFNIAADIAEDTILRFAYSKNITRPPIGTLSPNLTIRTDNFQDVQSGNPDLEPYTSDNIDIYIERYFGDVGYVTAGFFYKDVQNFITRAAREGVPYGTLDLPLNLLQPGQDESTPFTVVTFVNSQDSSIKGFEFAFQTELGFLSEALSGFGVIGNYTYADGSLDYVNQDATEIVTADFPGLSKHSANGTIYYETNDWGVRGSVAYRSDYITAVEVGLSDEDSRGALSTVFVDASAYYNISDGVKLTLEGLNLTNEREILYSDSSQRLQELRRSGATFLAGVSVQF